MRATGQRATRRRSSASKRARVYAMLPRLLLPLSVLLAIAAVVVSITATAALRGELAETRAELAALAAERPEPEPPAAWIVLATEIIPTADDWLMTIDYHGPGGAVQTWRRPIPDDDTLVGWAACWESVRLGEPLPDCARGALGIDTPPN